MNISLVHIFSISSQSLGELSSNGLHVVSVSLPAFVQQESMTYMAAQKSVPVLFNVDDFNYNNIKVPYLLRLKYQLPGEFIWQLLLQSERLSGYNEFSLSDKVVRFRDIFAFFCHMIDDLSIDAVVYGGLPHSVADYIYLLAARHLGLNVCILQDLPMFPGSAVPYDSYFALLNNSFALDLPVSGVYSIECHANWLRAKCRQVLYEFKSTGRFKFYQPNIQSNEWSSVYSGSKSDLVSHAGSDYFDRWLGCAKVHDISQVGELCISMFLHAEPEGFTNPGLPTCIYPQIEFIKLLSERSDANVRILIKEHPLMFSSYPQANPEYIQMVRSETMLKTMQEIPKVSLVNPAVDSNKLIEKSFAIATPSGSVSYQALFLRKPVIGTRLSGVSLMPGFVNIDEFSMDSLVREREILEAIGDEVLLTELISPVLPGSPNGAYNMFFTPQEPANSLALAISIVHLLRKSICQANQMHVASVEKCRY